MDDKKIAAFLLDLVVDDWTPKKLKSNPLNEHIRKGSALKAISSIKKEALDCLYASSRYKRAENLTAIALKVTDDEVREAAIEALTEIRDQAIYGSDREKINDLILKLVLE